MKMFFKTLLFVCTLIIATPFYLVYLMLFFFNETGTIFQGFSQFFSLAPGSFGNYLRKAFYFLTLKKCHRDSTISFGTIFSSSDCVIGKHVYIGTHCMIGRAVIEDDVLIGSNVHIISKYTHGYKDVTLPIRLQEGAPQVVHIGRDSWVGNGAIIMADISSHCVVGAGSVVSKQFNDFDIIAGNPARLIKNRNEVE